MQRSLGRKRVDPHPSWMWHWASPRRTRSSIKEMWAFLVTIWIGPAAGPTTFRMSAMSLARIGCSCSGSSPSRSRELCLHWSKRRRAGGLPDSQRFVCGSVLCHAVAGGLRPILVASEVRSACPSGFADQTHPHIAARPAGRPLAAHPLSFPGPTSSPAASTAVNEPAGASQCSSGSQTPRKN